MNGDVALAGFVLTAEEWQALDPATREQLVAVAHRERPAVVARTVTAVGSEPNIAPPPPDE
ncbi:MAG TPA: hypothetical protein VMJ10_12555 [Kofleriaceae bacterium]|nr:hypothetical protein [Kofleriaceae bacterium]